MTKLELVRMLAQQAGMARAPDTTVAQVGEFGRLCTWIDSALVSIEGDGERRWTWMWELATLTLPAGTSAIAEHLPASRYDRATLRDVTSGTDEFPPYLTYQPWRDFNRLYPRISANPTTTFSCWSVRPDNALVFNGVPIDDRTIEVERWRAPAALVGDDAVPGLPEDLHEIIVWRALVKYASFDEAGVQRATAAQEDAKFFNSLLMRCDTEMIGGFGPPLV